MGFEPRSASPSIIGSIAQDLGIIVIVIKPLSPTNEIPLGIRNDDNALATGRGYACDDLRLSFIGSRYGFRTHQVRGMNSDSPPRGPAVNLPLGILRSLRRDLSEPKGRNLLLPGAVSAPLCGAPYHPLRDGRELFHLPYLVAGVGLEPTKVFRPLGYEPSNIAASRSRCKTLLFMIGCGGRT